MFGFDIRPTTYLHLDAMIVQVRFVFPDSPPVLLAVCDVDHAGDVLTQELVTDLAQHLYNEQFLKDLNYFHFPSPQLAPA